jgi:hypothetical protein
LSKPKNAFEIFQFLDKSNCGECGEKTCLAFAGAVFLGQRRIRDCPKISPEAIERFAGESDKGDSQARNSEDRLAKLKSQITQIDLSKAAERVGASFLRRQVDPESARQRLQRRHKRKSLPRKSTSTPGWLFHFLSYILARAKGSRFRQMGALPGAWKEAAIGYPLFQKRCEEPMKRVADIYTSLFDDIVHVFGGKKVDKQFESDISVVLYPLPRVPIMICYWLPEDGMDSSLHVFFDETADRNLDIGSIFSLGTGLAQMFTKIALRHGFDARA